MGEGVRLRVMYGCRTYAYLRQVGFGCNDID